MNFEAYVRSLGHDPEALSSEMRVMLQAAWRAHVAATEAAASAVTLPGGNAGTGTTGNPTPTPTAATPPADPLAASRAREAAETRRVGEIRAACGNETDVAATAIEQGWDVDRARMQAELVALRRSRSTAPVTTFVTGHMPAGATINTVVEAALAQAIGSPGYERRFHADVLQAAHTQFRGRLGLGQVFMMAAQANGFRCSAGERVHAGNLREVMQHAMGFGPMASSGVTTFSLPGIMASTASKELLAGYMEEDQTWREVAGVKNVPDFKTITSYRMLDDMEFEEISATGEIPHGKVSEESYTRRAKSYAKMGALTRQDIINDDLGAFGDIRSRLGRGGAQKFNRVFWTAWLSNPSTFWTAPRTNYISGATTTLLTDGVGLGLGVKAFRKMKSPSADNAKAVAGRPEILLVPPELENAADVLHTNSNLGMVAGSSANTYAGKYKPVVSPFLSDDTITGYSATAWWLLRNPAISPAVVVSFLNGVQTPTIESADADFNILGVQFRGFWDFGCDQAEYLAGVKSKGAA